MNAHGESTGLRLASQPHSCGGDDKQPAKWIPGPQQPDDDGHHECGVRETQHEHGERIRPTTNIVKPLGGSTERERVRRRRV
jgi:hypothetical protein